MSFFLKSLLLFINFLTSFSQIQCTPNTSSNPINCNNTCTTCTISPTQNNSIIYSKSLTTTIYCTTPNSCTNMQLNFPYDSPQLTSINIFCTGNNACKSSSINIAASVTNDIFIYANSTSNTLTSIDCASNNCNLICNNNCASIQFTCNGNGCSCNGNSCSILTTTQTPSTTPVPTVFLEISWLGINILIWILIGLFLCCVICLCCLCIFYLSYMSTKKETKRRQSQQKSYSKNIKYQPENTQSSTTKTITNTRTGSSQNYSMPGNNKGISATQDGDITTHHMDIHEDTPPASRNGRSNAPTPAFSEGKNKPKNNGDFLYASNNPNNVNNSPDQYGLTNSTRASLQQVMTIIKEKPQIMLVMMDKVNSLNNQIRNNLEVSQQNSSVTINSPGAAYNNGHNRGQNSLPVNQYKSQKSTTRLSYKPENSNKTNVNVLTPTNSEMANMVHDKYLRKQKIINDKNVVISNMPLPDENEYDTQTQVSAASSATSASSSSASSSGSASSSSSASSSGSGSVSDDSGSGSESGSETETGTETETESEEPNKPRNVSRQIYQGGHRRGNSSKVHMASV